MEGMTPERAATDFEALAKEAFADSSALGWMKWAKAILFGAIYSDRAIEAPLRSVHGRQRLSDASYATRIGTRIGILTASTERPRIHVLSNYNGIGEPRIGYNAVSNIDSLYTWEA